MVVLRQTKVQKRYVLRLDSAAANCKNRFFKALPAEVLVVKGEGIDSVIGSGSYLYEEEVKISASVSSGYIWYQWKNRHIFFHV